MNLNKSLCCCPSPPSQNDVTEVTVFMAPAIHKNEKTGNPMGITGRNAVTLGQFVLARLRHRIDQT
jgi:hypothetical protein